MTGPTKTERSNLNFGARGKRRSLSQRVGKDGQLLFEQWAVEQSLVANRCNEDYGIDYFCQVLSLPSGKYKTEEIRGDIFAVQVRATMGASRPRIKLDKIDAETALRIESPYAIIAVDRTKKKVYFKFLDAEFAKQLAAFIASGDDALILRLESAAFSSNEFRTALTQHCNPGAQHRLRIYCAELCLQKDIPGARLRISHDATSGFALVEVPWISSIFRVPPENEEEFRRVVFEHGQMPEAGMYGVSVHPSLFKVLDIAGTDQLIVKGTFEHDIRALIQLGGVSEWLTFRVRTAGDEIAFVSECGLVLTMSKPRSDPSGAFFHKLYFALSQEYGRSLDTFSKFDRALRLLKPGATLSFNTTGSSGINIKSWGPALEHLGEGYEHILLAYAFAGISLDDVYLADLMNEEFARSIAVLASFSSGATLPQLMPSFLVGPAASDSKYGVFCVSSG